MRGWGGNVLTYGSQIAYFEAPTGRAKDLST